MDTPDWRRVALAVGAGVGLVVVAVAVFGLPVEQLFTPTGTSASAGLSANDTEYEVVAENLDTPWEVVVLDENRLLVTERTGDLVLIENGSRHVLREFDNLDRPTLGEGGLLGIARHPNFTENHQLYVYLTVDREPIQNTIRRFEVDFAARELTNQTTIIDGVPSHRFHNGGRIAFGPDGYLYVTTGDAKQASLAQNRSSLAGKILRLRADGSVPADNPFDNPVYSLGHRNPQGLAWDDQGRLWATEHGPSARDELNLIEPGHNYGWPTITGTQTQSGMEAPVYTSGQYETWAPAGIAVADRSVFFAGLRGERLYEARLVDDRVTSFVAHFSGEFGRLRAVTLGPDGEYLYLTTSNTDGRGEERPADDRLIRIPVAAFR